MIVFFESGRLGNQLFQYAALRSCADPGERLVLVGFDELRGMFESLEATFPVSSRSIAGRILLNRIRPHLDRLAARQSFVGVVSEDVEHGPCRLESRRGRLRNLRYCLTAYFQSEAVFDPAVVGSLKMRATYLRSARERLEAAGPPGRTRIFVHVRLGDYASFPSPDAPALLPAAWYHECIAEMRRRYVDPIFILCSDDPAMAAPFVEQWPGCILSTGSTYEDFALMSQCEAGILSASSYSWWAAWFSAREAAGRVFLAPQYWIGHATGEWFPPGVNASFLTYVRVPDGGAVPDHRKLNSAESEGT